MSEQTIQRPLSDEIISRLVAIESKLDSIENNFQRERRVNRYGYISSIGLVFMVAGMGLATAKEEFVNWGGIIFIVGLIILLIGWLNLWKR